MEFKTFETVKEFYNSFAKSVRSTKPKTSILICFKKINKDKIINMQKFKFYNFFSVRKKKQWEKNKKNIN